MLAGSFLCFHVPAASKLLHLFILVAKVNCFMSVLARTVLESAMFKSHTLQFGYVPVDLYRFPGLNFFVYCFLELWRVNSFNFTLSKFGKIPEKDCYIGGVIKRAHLFVVECVQCNFGSQFLW